MKIDKLHIKESCKKSMINYTNIKKDLKNMIKEINIILNNMNKIKQINIINNCIKEETVSINYLRKDIVKKSKNKNNTTFITPNIIN